MSHYSLLRDHRVLKGKKAKWWRKEEREEKGKGRNVKRGKRRKGESISIHKDKKGDQQAHMLWDEGSLS